MNTVRILAQAKINLYLEVVGPRLDGYTDVVLILQSLALADEVLIQPSTEIQIHCDHPLVPCDQRNLAYQAVQLLQKHAQITQGATITLHKKIPVAAGLAGGSANGAAVLLGLNKLWDLGLTPLELLALGAHLGSDVPFCLVGGTVLGYGRGEQIAPLRPLPPTAVVLVKPRTLAVSTAWAYGTYRELGYPPSQGSLTGALSALAQEQTVALYNDLERAVLPHHPQIQRIKDQLLHGGAQGVLMSGSGPTVFALTPDLDQAQRIASTISPLENEVLVTQTFIQGLTWD